MSEWQDTEYGKAPSDWRVLTLGEMSEKITDGAHQSPKPQVYGKYMCSVKDMTYDKFDFNGCKLISEEDYKNLVKQGCQPKSGDILISKDGANCLDLIFIFRQNEELVLLSSIAIARLLPEYVRYFLLSPDCQYTMRNNYVSGSAIPRVVLKDFKKIPILVPECGEQKAIALVLSSLDDKIDLLHRQNKTLEAMAETLFRQWFVEESHEDWDSRGLLDVVQLVGGGTPKTSVSDYWDGDIPWLAGGDIATNHKSFVNNSEKKITQEGLCNSSAKLLPRYATIISARGTVGKYCLLAEPMVFSQSNYGILPNIGECFFFTYLLINHVVEELQSSAYGSVFDTITTNTFKDIKMSLPGRHVIEEFEKTVVLFFQKILANKGQITTLEKLRDTLLPKLMSGEIRVIP
ncbi:MAG: restriction endonuclease subunit S [Cyanophyceae cyanobacterium]